MTEEVQKTPKPEVVYVGPRVLGSPPERKRSAIVAVLILFVSFLGLFSVLTARVVRRILFGPRHPIHEERYRDYPGTPVQGEPGNDG